VRRLPDPAALERRASRPPAGDTKPTAAPQVRPPRAAEAERKARIARIIARANGTSVAEEQAKLDEIARFERTLALQDAAKAIAQHQEGL